MGDKKKGIVGGKGKKNQQTWPKNRILMVKGGKGGQVGEMKKGNTLKKIALSEGGPPCNTD